MKTTPSVTPGEWRIMQLLWQKPHTLMELVGTLGASVGWSKSTVATMVRRMEEKFLITHTEQGRTKYFHPAISQDDAAAAEADSLLDRAFHGSLGLLVSSMARRNALSKEDIDELYAILQNAKEDAK